MCIQAGWRCARGLLRPTRGSLGEGREGKPGGRTGTVEQAHHHHQQVGTSLPAADFELAVQRDARAARPLEGRAGRLVCDGWLVGCRRSICICGCPSQQALLLRRQGSVEAHLKGVCLTARSARPGPSVSTIVGAISHGRRPRWWRRQTGSLLWSR